MFSHKIGRCRAGQIGIARDLLSHRNLRTTPQYTTIEQEGSSQSGLCSADCMKVQAAKIGPLTLNQRVPGSSPGAPTTQSSGIELRG